MWRGGLRGNEALTRDALDTIPVSAPMGLPSTAEMEQPKEFFFFLYTSVNSTIAGHVPHNINIIPNAAIHSLPGIH
mgnify:CR=1 FL=1